jgi:hypothetical protein
MPTPKTISNRWQAREGGGGSAVSSTAAAAKKVGKVGLLAASPAVSVTQMATGNASIALVAAGAAASATGIGLIVVGAAATLTVSTLSAVSAYKTWQHCKALDAIYDRRKTYACGCVIAGDTKDVEGHNQVANVVLPYICLQKSEKVGRKAVGAVPVAGLSETAYAIGRNLYKRYKGTKGVKRTEMAEILAAHFVTHDCALAQAIVADLYTFEQMTWLLRQNYSDVATLLAEKMQSR